ncbi:MAG: rhodanese-like domain-containing protein [Defluviicoccus sp.]|nr:MAG: rhodanese-like domain-containing protein [Defluviicoccus sp.]
MQNIDVTEAQALAQSGAVVVDVRRPDEWRATGVVPGSLLITAFDANGQPVAGFVEAVRSQVKPDAPLVLICRSGNRSAAAAQMLSAQDDDHSIYSMAGGVSAWARSGASLKPCPSC